MRYFFSSGEASGELAATILAQAIRRIDPAAEFEGIGAQRMRDLGFSLWRDHTGWASMGPLAAIPRIPKLLAVMLATARHIVRTQPDLVVLVDFGAFNVRLAQRLRALGYGKPILDIFPPGAWLDRPATARAVAAAAHPVPAFAHQRDFYRSLGLPVAYFGHPLTGEYQLRAMRAAPPADGGTVAILPGSRAGELRMHVPVLLAALRELNVRRPHLRAVAGAADAQSEATLRKAFARMRLSDVRIVRGVRAAIADADAAWVSSGTAVLECALSGVPAVAFYIIVRSLVAHARRVYRGRFITIPNLVLQREVIPELVQERATPHALATQMDAVLRDPTRQYAQFTELRAALGPADALERCAAYAVEVAKGS